MQDKKEVLKKILSEKIKKYRKSSNKSISLICNEIDLSKSIWSDLEKGIKDPQFSTLWRIAEGLNIPLSEIIIEIEHELKGKINFIEN